MISIVIPIYNEEENLQNLYTRLANAAPSWKEDYEIVLIDDGSRDSSLTMMRVMAEKDTHVRVIKLSRNFGHQPAISAGIQEAKGDAIIIMDGDLQDPPEELYRFLDKWREGYEVVYAIRTKRKEGFFKKIAYSSFYRMKFRLIREIFV
jgi:polyisoprenyl-phosphate glycosyltransferase